MAEFRWFGHNCFRVRAKEATVITDPVGRETGYVVPKQTADVVTLSHRHPGHANLGLIKSEHHVIDGPGEYEMHDVFVTGIRTYHDAEQGKERGYNTVYLIELEGMVICHLGDLGHPLTEEQAEAMANVDVLMVAAGGGPVLEPARAAEIIGLLEPKVVIPMQYATPYGDKSLTGIDAFCAELGSEVPAPIEKLVMRSSELGDVVRVVALTPEPETRR